MSQLGAFRNNVWISRGKNIPPKILFICDDIFIGNGLTTQSIKKYYYYWKSRYFCTQCAYSWR